MVAGVVGKDVLNVEVSAVRDEPAPDPRITVVQALPKGDRGELAVETMTEAGVDVIVPWAAARCVTQWRGDRGAKSLAKWRATAREAAKQSRRLRFPEVTEPVTTRQLAGLLGAADFAGVLHEEGATPLATAPLPAAGSLVLVVGPEGGVAPEELAAFAETGAPPTGWAPRCCGPPPRAWPPPPSCSPGRAAGRKPGPTATGPGRYGCPPPPWRGAPGSYRIRPGR